MKSKIMFFIIGIVMLCYPKLNLGQVPNLGTASNFALFTAVGAFNNTGATTVIGDVGTNVGLFSAFPSGTLLGQIHVADLVSQQAAIDVNAAYSYLSSMVCDSVIGTTLGVNQILTPKVYCLGAASVLNGDLILNGQGNPNSIFIFKIDGAFSTSVSSNIVLINSAQLHNVYWQINGAVDIADSSVFRGTIIANGAISLLESSSLFGRGLSIAGAINLHHTSVDISKDGALSIALLSFDAECLNEKTNLKWTTATETNNDFFTIEFSANAINWMALKQINGAGNSTTLLNYSYIDLKQHSSATYYRLKQTDFDGRIVYSKIIEANNCFVDKAEIHVTLSPNPSNGIFNLSTNASQGQILSVGFYNSSGKQIYYSENDNTTIDLSYLQSGMYFGIFTTDKNSITKKIVIEK
jgi:hypothetical protein